MRGSTSLIQTTTYAATGQDADSVQVCCQSDDDVMIEEEIQIHELNSYKPTQITAECT